MKINKTSRLLASLVLVGLALAFPQQTIALEFNEVREFGEVFKISAQANSHERIEVSWEIAQDYYLYNNKFLSFKSDTAGVVLGMPEIPTGKSEFDELLGEDVVKYHDRLTVGLPLQAVPEGVHLISLRVRSQGCLENVLCYPPTEQLLAVSLSPSTPVFKQAEPVASVQGLFNQTATAAGQNVVGEAPALEPEDAFIFEAIGYSAEIMLVRFTAQPGYYLYRDKFDFRVVGDGGFEVRDVELPGGTIKDDPEFGPLEVYFGLVEVPLKLNRPAGAEQAVTLEADYQGCRDGDICYPPQTSQVELLMPASAQAIRGDSDSIATKTATTPAINPGAKPEAAIRAPATAAAEHVSEQDRLASLLQRNPGGALFAFFIAGLLLAFTPCVFPMVPILSGIIVGQGDRMTTARAFWLSLVYVLAMAVTYTVAGVLAGLFGQNLQAVFQNPWILGFFIAVFIALALSMFGFYELQLPARLQTRLTQASSQQQGGSLTGVAVMGFLSALIVGPCVAPPLAAALIVIGASGSAVLGGTALFALSMGMGVPLILFGVSAGKLVPKAGAWMDAIKAVFGFGLLALAIWMLERIVQGPVILLLWGMLAIAAGVYLGGLERVSEGASGWSKLWKSLGLVFLLLGAIEVIGAASGGHDWTRPLKNIRVGAPAATVVQVEFERIKSLDDLDAAVIRANQSGKHAMLDFYADWCVECLRMERKTFPEPEIQALFEQIQPLQADVTANDATDKALMARFGIIGPPAILFFDRRGDELKGYRLVGYFEPAEFAGHLRKVLDTQ